MEKKQERSAKWLRQIWSFALAVMIAAGCRVETIVKPVSREDQARMAAQDNAQMVIGAGDVLEITARALNAKGISSGRKATGISEGECDPFINLLLHVDRTRQDSLVYTGVLSTSYGDGVRCTLNEGRTGTVRNEFRLAVSLKNKAAFLSTETITFGGYRKDNIQYDGVLKVLASNGKRTLVEARGAKITYGDGTASTWNGLLYFKSETSASSGGKNKGIAVRVTGSLSGSTRQGAKYSGTISEDVLFKVDCVGKKEGVPVSGTMRVTIDGNQSTVNYGDGTCDKKYTISVAGEDTEYTFS